MTSIHCDLERILAEITNQARYSFIEKYIRRPETPVFFVQVLFHMMRSYSLPADRIRLYCVSAALLKMGLDAHENVSDEKELTDEGMRSRQLTVLAGDYFSSLFYGNLARQGEIDGIARLSEAICDINEAKMDWYAVQKENKRISWSAHIQLMRRIHGGLISALSRFFYDETVHDQSSWDLLAGNLLTLAAEKERGTGLPEEMLHSLSVETLQLAKEIRPLEVRADVIRLIRNTVIPQPDELVREG